MEKCWNPNLGFSGKGDFCEVLGEGYVLFRIFGDGYWRIRIFEVVYM